MFYTIVKLFTKKQRNVSTSKKEQGGGKKMRYILELYIFRSRMIINAVPSITRIL